MQHAVSRLFLYALKSKAATQWHRYSSHGSILPFLNFHFHLIHFIHFAFCSFSAFPRPVCHDLWRINVLGVGTWKGCPLLIITIQSQQSSHRSVPMGGTLTFPLLSNLSKLSICMRQEATHRRTPQ